MSDNESEDSVDLVDEVEDEVIPVDNIESDDEIEEDAAATEERDALHKERPIIDVDDEEAEADVEEEGEEEEGEEQTKFDFVPRETERRLIKNVVVVAPEKRRTSHIINHTEMTELISIRSGQIAQRNNVMTNVEGYDDPIKMAKKELNDGKCPLTLRRKVGESMSGNELTEYFEYWDVNLMVKAVVYDI